MMKVVVGAKGPAVEVGHERPAPCEVLWAVALVSPIIAGNDEE